MADKKIVCTATIEDDFADDSVIVVVNKSNSKINKKHRLSSYLSNDFTDIYDLSEVGENNVNKKYVNSDEFQQVLYLKLKKTGKKEVLKAIEKLEKLEWVESAEPNYIQKVLFDDEEAIAFRDMSDPSLAYTTVNDPKSSEQYALSRIGAHAAWDFTTGQSAIRVGVVDSGISKHSDLVDNLTVGWDFVNNNNITDDDIVGHGTHVAGIIGATGNNGIGITGVCWDITLVPLQVTYNSRGNVNIDAACRAIQYAANNDIPIINCSFGGTGSNAYEVCMRNYSGLIVCAAGNSGLNNDNTPFYPASSTLDNVISVANMNKTGGLYPSSNYGATSVDIAAYGTNILSTYKGNTYVELTGTSMAAPFVTATAALMLSYRPDLDALTIKEIILSKGNTSTVLTGKVQSSRGLLNTYAAVLSVCEISPPAKALTGDIDGDGKADIVSIGKHGYANHGYVNIQYASTNSGFGNVYSSERKVVNYNDDIWLQDINGDGREDLVCRVGEGQWDTGYIYVALSTGNGFNFWSYSSGHKVVSLYDEIYFGDVNGDNKQDIICRGVVNQSDYGYIYVALSTGNGFHFWSSITSRKVTNHGDRLWLGDVNGDGKDDIICEGDFAQADAGYIYVALSTGNSFVFWSSVTDNQVLKNVDDKLWVGDINGDKRMDLIVQTGLNAWDTGYIWTALSNGTSFDFWTYNSGSRVVSDRDEIILGDIDGNDRIDLIVRGGSGNWDTGYIWSALSNGVGFTFWSARTEHKVVNPRDKIFVNDVNGDSKTDIIAIGGYGYSDQGQLWVALSGGLSFSFWSWHGGVVGV